MRNLPKIIEREAGAARGQPQPASPGVSAPNHESEAAALNPVGPAQIPRLGVAPHGSDGHVWAAHPVSGSRSGVLADNQILGPEF